MLTGRLPACREKFGVALPREAQWR
jgi:hypothetical protein